MEKSVVLGIDIGGTNTIYGFVTCEGTIVFHDEIPTNVSKSISNLVERISDYLKEFFYKNRGYTLNGIGIGAPNGNHYTGMIQSPPNLSWGCIDIVSLFKEKMHCETLLTNDANAAALGEKSFGLAKHMDDFVVVTLGTGLGSGIFSSGKLLYGHDGFAGEMGHISIDFNGRLCNCGNKGCLEAYVSATGINNTIQKLLEKDPRNTLLQTLCKDNIDGFLLDKSYDQGNETAIKIYHYTGEKLGQGLALVANLFSPEAFIFYGGFSNAGERIFASARKSMKHNLINSSGKDIKLIQSGLPQGQAGILGAASLIWTK